MDTTPVRMDELLAHAGWVRRLAARLVRDADVAEDVAQEVWAHALRSPPRDRRNLRGWLAAAVRSTALTLKRSESRRTSRETAVAPAEVAPATSDLVARAHLHRELVEHVLALEEPHRSIVLAHWFEEESLASIARRLGLTEKVTRSRLDAAHARLRQRMDERAGGRREWMCALSSWTGALPATGAGSAVALGGVLVATKYAVAGALVLAAGTLTWILWLDESIPPPIAEVAREDGAQALDPRVETAELAPRGEASAAREALEIAEQRAPTAPSAATSARWLVRGTVRGAPAGSVTETRLTARFLGAFSLPDGAATNAESDGNFVIDVTSVLSVWRRGAEPTELQVLAEHPLCQRGEVRVPFSSAARTVGASGSEDSEFRCTLDLRAGAIVTGRLVMPEGWQPASGWEGEPVRPRVGLFDLAEGSTSEATALDLASCDADGRWILRGSRGGVLTVVGCAEGLRPMSHAVQLTLGRSVDLGDLPVERGLTISGSVRSGGLPVGAGVEIEANAQPRESARYTLVASNALPMQLGLWQGRLEHSILRTRTADDGTFRFVGLAPREYGLEVRQASDTRAGVGRYPRIELTLQAPQSGVVLEHVPPVVELLVTVEGRAPTDAELEGVIVELTTSSPLSSGADLDLTRSSRGYGRIQLVAGVPYELRVRPGRHAGQTLSLPPFASGEQRTVTLDLQPDRGRSTLAVRLLTERSEELPHARIGLEDRAAAPSAIEWVDLRRSPEGKFVLEHSPGSYRVHVQPSTSGWLANTTLHRTAVVEVDLAAGKTLELDVQLSLGGRMRLTAKDEHGGPVRAEVELRDESGAKISTDFYCPSGEGTVFRCGGCLCEQGPNDHLPLPPGRYELRLSAEGFVRETLTLDLVAGETATRDFVMRRL
jgi:RNA polymerase sigma factor (sigma-70 family)